MFLDFFFITNGLFSFCGVRLIIQHLKRKQIIHCMSFICFEDIIFACKCLRHDF
jgi:hypothetical protein